MNKWLLKTEPDDYSFSDLLEDGKTIWDGVTNNWALKNMREVRIGDEAFIYHTGKEKCIAGIARIVSDPHPDPQLSDERRIVFDLEPVKKLPCTITLSMLKTDKFFSGFMLLKFSRLSVMPVEEKYWRRILDLSASEGEKK